jgi:hypothetical protein
MYKLIKNNQTGEVTTVLRIKDNTYFPLNALDNTDYQAYLKWLEEGGVPIPADEVTQ